MSWRVPLSDLDFGAEEEQAVVEVLRRGWLTMGSVTQQFEEQFAQMCGVRHAIAVTNATAALHLACLALEIGPGDEVILPSLTFVATANAVLYTGARVRFADICSLDNLTISPQEIERQITPRTRAIIVMHYAGYPCAMEEIMEIARQHRLAVIEDAAHAPGGSLDGKALGCWGEAGCFSFFSNKNLVTGEGGMLVTEQDDLAERFRLLRSHGMTSLTWDRHTGHASSYDVIDLGYNYRLDEIRAGLGLVQLRKLEQNNRKRAEITRVMHGRLAGWQEAGLILPFSGRCDGNLRCQPAYHILPVLLPENIDRTGFMEVLKEAGVQSSIHYPPIHLFTAYRKYYQDISLPVTEEAARREVTLPLYPGMGEEQVEIVSEAFEKAFEFSRGASLSWGKMKRIGEGQ